MIHKCSISNPQKLNWRWAALAHSSPVESYPLHESIAERLRRQKRAYFDKSSLTVFRPMVFGVMMQMNLAHLELYWRSYQGTLGFPGLFLARTTAVDTPRFQGLVIYEVWGLTDAKLAEVALLRRRAICDQTSCGPRLLIAATLVFFILCSSVATLHRARSPGECDYLWSREDQATHTCSRRPSRN